MAPFTPIIPDWLDQVKGVDFAPEKALLNSLETWDAGQNWDISDGHELSQALRERTDVLIQNSKTGDRVRVTVFPKHRDERGSIRLDSSTIRTVELCSQPKTQKWRIEIGAAPIEDDVQAAGYQRVFDLLFKP
jgi:hypothetical protein